MGRKRYPVWNSVNLHPFPNSPKVKALSGRMIIHQNNIPIQKNLPRTLSVLAWTRNHCFSYNDTHHQESVSATLKAAVTQMGETLNRCVWSISTQQSVQGCPPGKRARPAIFLHSRYQGFFSPATPSPVAMKDRSKQICIQCRESNYLKEKTNSFTFWKQTHI